MVRFQGLNSTLSVAGFKVQGLGEGSWVQERVDLIAVRGRVADRHNLSCDVRIGRLRVSSSEGSSADLGSRF